jgi:hypothetical protein
MPTSREYFNDSSDTIMQQDRPTLIQYSAASDDHRYLRSRTAIPCAEFNAQSIDVSDANSVRVWYDYIISSIKPAVSSHN